MNDLLACPCMPTRTLVILATLLTIAACDAPSAAPEHNVTFRGDGYKASYITEYQGAQDDEPQAIDFDRFVEAFLACKAQEPDLEWTVTLTRYHPDLGAKPDRVVGFGGSTLSHGPAIQCWEKKWEANGEVFLP